jgi:hypothetical protein
MQHAARPRSLALALALALASSAASAQGVAHQPDVAATGPKDAGSKRSQLPATQPKGFCKELTRATQAAAGDFLSLAKRQPKLQAKKDDHGHDHSGEKDMGELMGRFARDSGAAFGAEIRPAKALPGAQRAELSFSGKGLIYVAHYGLVFDEGLGAREYDRLVSWVKGCGLPGEYKHGTDDKTLTVDGTAAGKPLMRTVRNAWLPQGKDHPAPLAVLLVVGEQAAAKGAWTLSVHVMRKGSGHPKYKPKR